MKQKIQSNNRNVVIIKYIKSLQVNYDINALEKPMASAAEMERWLITIGNKRL